MEEKVFPLVEPLPTLKGNDDEDLELPESEKKRKFVQIGMARVIDANGMGEGESFDLERSSGMPVVDEKKFNMYAGDKRFAEKIRKQNSHPQEFWGSETICEGLRSRKIFIHSIKSAP